MQGLREIDRRRRSMRWLRRTAAGTAYRRVLDKREKARTSAQVAY
jgi:hypothetical protein